MNDARPSMKKLGAWMFAMALLFGLAAAPALARSAIAGEVLVVLASNGSRGIAPELQGIEALRQAPFNAFSELRLLERATLSLDVGQPVERALPNGRTLRIEVLERTAEGRLRVRVSIQRQGSNDYLPLLTVLATPDVPFFVAGQSFQGGTLVIGVKVR